MPTSHSSVFYDPFNYEIQKDPYPVFKELRDEAPLYYVEERDLWVLSRDSDIRSVVQDWKTYSNREGVDIDKTDSLLSPGHMDEKDGEEHDKYRALVQKWFGPKQIKDNLVDPLTSETSKLVSAFKEKGEGNFVEEVAWQLPGFVITHMFDAPEEDRVALLSFMKPVFERIPNDPIPPQESIDSGEKIADWCTNLIERRRTESLDGRTDLLSVLMQSELDGNPLTNDQIMGIISHLIVASSGTTQDLISNSIWLLGTHPEQRQLLKDRRDAIPNAIEECLRYEAVVQSVSRVTNEEVEFYGTKIPVGATVVNMLGSANRDERKWENPDAFDVTRNTQGYLGDNLGGHGGHMSFADGIHLCIGRPIARLEAKLVVNEVLDQMPDYQITSAPKHAVSHVARGLEVLNVSVG